MGFAPAGEGQTGGRGSGRRDRRHRQSVGGKFSGHPDHDSPSCGPWCAVRSRTGESAITRCRVVIASCGGWRYVHLRQPRCNCGRIAAPRTAGIDAWRCDRRGWRDRNGYARSCERDQPCLWRGGPRGVRAAWPRLAARLARTAGVSGFERCAAGWRRNPSCRWRDQGRRTIAGAGRREGKHRRR